MVCAIRCGKAGRSCPGWRNCLQWLRLALCRWVAGGIDKGSGWRFVVESLVDGLRVGCDPFQVNRASVAALVVCVQDSKQDSKQEKMCSAWPVLGGE